MHTAGVVKISGRDKEEAGEEIIMGREIRRVPADWEHPKRDCPHNPWQGGCDDAKRDGGKCFQPLYDRDFESEMQKWLDGAKAWLDGEFEEVRGKYPGEGYRADEPYRALIDWSGKAPDPKYYRPKWDEAEVTWFQAYETVSEGTPVSPAFETQEELAQYLAENGDYWYQNDVRRGRSGYRTKPTIEQARSFVGTGWAVSTIVELGSSGLRIMDAYEQQDLKATN